MRGYDEIDFVDGENGVHVVFCKGYHIGFIMWDDKSNEHYFESNTECELTLYAGHMVMILAKLIELNQAVKQ